MQRALFHTGFSAGGIKWLAITCMLIDHIAWAFVPTFSPLGLFMHAFGRVTAPCMCFFIAEGYAHTRSVAHYAARLLLFALVSWPRFSFFETGKLFTANLGMLWSLLFCLLAVWAADTLPSLLWRVLAVAGCVLATLPGDWPVWSVVFTLCFWYTRQAPFPGRAGAFALAAAGMAFAAGGGLAWPRNAFWICTQLCVLAALLPLAFYRGRRGGQRHPGFQKWAFYGFYPAHLLLLGCLRYSN